ncbi:MAG: hypothetical protein QME82_08945, partial [Bacillota bacterium]|nr:hypothetical protein [Bacillota bacterium]
VLLGYSDSMSAPAPRRVPQNTGCQPTHAKRQESLPLLVSRVVPGVASTTQRPGARRDSAVPGASAGNS